jgi:hypothetical protein
MLDPLTALSIAGAVVQFTDFGIKLASNVKEICESADGVLIKNAEYETGGRFWKTLCANQTLSACRFERTAFEG